MKKRPILFSTPMVRAILDGRKTQTRRVIDVPESTTSIEWVDCAETCPQGSYTGWVVKCDAPMLLPRKCPYGVPGDVLWVRETWIEKAWTDSECRKVGCQDAPEHPDKSYLGSRLRAIHKASFQTLYGDVGRWRPSIHMPFWACRLFLRVTDVRVERVQEISEADAISEGLTPGVCADVFDRAADKIKAEEAFYAEKEDGKENDGWLCRKHAEEFAGPNGYVGWGCTPEIDGPGFCEVCYVPLVVSLSEYGIDRELRIEDDPNGDDPKMFPLDGGESRLLEMVSGGIGDLQETQHGRLAQIGFSTLWNSINAKRGYGWEANPWVWVVCFERIEKDAALQIIGEAAA